MDAATLKTLLSGGDAPGPDRPTALITGASAGLGAIYAERFARAGCNLVLVARQAARLERLKERLGAQHGIECLVIARDLSTPGAPKELFDRVNAEGWAIDILVNNAGFGYYGSFTDEEPANVEAMCGVNVAATALLANLFARPMAARRRGIIINVGSGAGFSPMPLFGLYAATKAFLLSFSQSLAAELEPGGVRVICVCPGATATEFHAVAIGNGPGKPSALPDFMKPEAIVDASLRALTTHQRVVTPGWKTRVQTGLLRLLPADLSMQLAMKAIKKRMAGLSAPLPPAAS
jgi:short-subunit dehydrogenase